MPYSIKNKIGILSAATIVTALSMTMLTATTIISYGGMQQAFAAKECTFAPGTSCFCYGLQPGGILCFGNKGDCQKSQRSNAIAASGCFKYEAF
jgi:hypothetical protein